MTPPTGPTLGDCRAWCASFLERVSSFLDAQETKNKRDFRYRANPGEVYRVRFDHRGVICVTEWGTGRHVVTSLPGQPTEPNMNACMPAQAPETPKEGGTR